MQELASDFFQSDFIKSIVDFGTQAINVIDKMVDSFGSWGSVMIAIGGGTAIKGLAWPKIIGDKAEANADKNIS